MEFGNVRKWILKMNNILEVYSHEESFTQSEKNLLLDYNLKIREAIKAINVEDSEVDEVPEEIPHPTKQETDVTKNIKAQEFVEVVEEIPTELKIQKTDYNRYNELFLFKKVEDLSEKLESTPITNIQKSMGLNERILTQNELFGGEKSSFDTAVQKLNGLDDFEQVKTYLCEELIPKYDWMDETRIKKAQWFIKLVKRKYS